MNLRNGNMMMFKNLNPDTQTPRKTFSREFHRFLKASKITFHSNISQDQLGYCLKQPLRGRTFIVKDIPHHFPTQIRQRTPKFKVQK